MHLWFLKINYIERGIKVDIKDGKKEKKYY